MARSAISKTEKEEVADSVVAENATAENNANVESSEKENKDVVVKEASKSEKKEVSKKPFTLNANNKVQVYSKTRAEKSIVAVTGKTITFDKNGYADVDVEDALYLKNIAGFSCE